MIERRLTDAADGVKEALGELVPPPVTDLSNAPRTDTSRQTGSPPLWRGPMIAIGTAVAIIAVVGVSLLMLGGSSGFDLADEPSATTLSESVATTTAAPTTTIGEAPTTNAPIVDGVVPGLWDSILATTKAKAAPPAATCPAGTDPDAPGPADQARPGEGPWNNQAAVFDTRKGQIVYLDGTAEMWTFDVCANTWRQMNPTMAPSSDPGTFVARVVGELVYDIDSDRTIVIGPRFVSVYDASINTWTQQSLVPSGRGFGSPGLGAVYDPVSGLVLVVTSDGLLIAYDVDTDGWAEIGVIMAPREITSEGQTQTLGPPFLVGHVAEADRLAFLGFGGAPFQNEGALINPRTGGTEPLTDPPGGVSGGFGSFSYATSGETAYTNANGICRLDPVTFDWDCVARDETQGTSAMVYDPINDRLVVINDWCCSWPGTTVTDNVQAIDFNTGETLELLATANTRIEQGGS